MTRHDQATQVVVVVVVVVAETDEGLYEKPGERLTGRGADLQPTVDSGAEVNEGIDGRK